jgi:FkbM family methyltransferase
MWKRLSFNHRNFLIEISFLRKIRYFLADFFEFLSNRKFEVLHNVIDLYSIDTIFDIGANIGQFGLEMRRVGFKGKIYSYEPVAESFSYLEKRVRKDERWTCIKLGLGSQSDELQIGISNNYGLSSSLLPILASHVEESPSSGFIGYEKIQLSTIDREISRLGVFPNKTLFKIDVQGYELEVLLGALNNIKNMAVLLIEVSLAELYEGTPTLKEILTFFEENSNHQVINIFRSFSKSNGNLLQVDILLIRSSNDSIVYPIN